MPKRRESILIKLIKNNLCFFCYLGRENDDGSCGKMEKSSRIWAHRKCLQYNSRLWQYDEDLGFGGFKIDLALKAFKATSKYPCHSCSSLSWRSTMRPGRKNGASCGCAVKTCRRAFHFPCAPHHAKIQKKNSRGKVLDFFRVWCSEKHKDVDMRELETLNVDEFADSSSGEESDADVPGPESSTKKAANGEKTDGKSNANGVGSNKDVKVFHQTTRLVRSDGKGLVEVSSDITSSLPSSVKNAPSRRASKNMGSILDTINSSILNSFVPIVPADREDEDGDVDDVENGDEENVGENDATEGSLGQKRRFEDFNGEDEPRAKVSHLTNGAASSATSTPSSSSQINGDLDRVQNESVNGVAHEDVVRDKLDDVVEFDSEGVETEVGSANDGDEITVSRTEVEEDCEAARAKGDADDGRNEDDDCPAAESRDENSRSTPTPPQAVDAPAASMRSAIPDSLVFDSHVNGTSEITRDDESDVDSSPTTNATAAAVTTATSKGDSPAVTETIAASNGISTPEPAVALNGHSATATSSNGTSAVATASALHGDAASPVNVSSPVDDSVQSGGIRAAVIRVLEALNFLKGTDEAVSSDADAAIPTGNHQTSPAPSWKISKSSANDLFLCVSTSASPSTDVDRLREQTSELFPLMGLSKESPPKILTWPDCVVRSSPSLLPRELALYHVMEVVRALSEFACGVEGADGNDDDDKNALKQRRQKRDEKLRTHLRNLILVEVAEDDLDGYRSLRKMDISLSEGGSAGGGVGGIIMEGYRDTLEEETVKIREKISSLKIFHKDIGNKRGGGANTVESALFILLNEAVDPRAEIRRQLTTLKVRSWSKDDAVATKRIVDHAAWPPEEDAVKEEAESIVNYIQEATKARLRLSVIPKDPFFIDETGNPVLQLIQKLVQKQNSSTRPTPGRHEVTLLQVAPSDLVPNYVTLALKALLEFVDVHFAGTTSVDDAESATASSSWKPSFFVAPSHSGGKVVLDPYELIGDALLTTVFAKWKLVCDVVTVCEPDRINSVFLLAIHRS